MKIKDIIIEDGGITAAGNIASSVPGNIFSVPIKRNQTMVRKRQKKESNELFSKKELSKVIEEKE